MIFIPGHTYRFSPKKGWKTRLVETVNRPKDFTFLRSVGKINLFRIAESGCRESFTREQAEDFTIEERN